MSAGIRSGFALTLDEHATISHASSMMISEDTHHVLIVSSDRTLVGVVSAKDIVRWVTEYDAGLRSTTRSPSGATPAADRPCLGWFIYRMSTGVPPAVASAETFTLLAVCEWFNVLNCLSERRLALSVRIFKNPWLLGGLVVGNLLQIAVIFVPAFNKVFHTVPFGIAIGVVGSLVLWAEELRKLVARRRQAPRPTTHARWEHATR